MDLETKIRQYLSANLIYADDDFEYGNDDSFISEGLIDSMGVMELVAFVQSEFGVAVNQEELTPENFDSVNKLAGYVSRKTGRALTAKPKLESAAYSLGQ